MDHNTPTWPLSEPVTDAIAKAQLDALERNCAEFGVRLEDRFSPLQGIVHVIGPELGLTQPGMTIVCGDSHTSTHGAFGALAGSVSALFLVQRDDTAERLTRIERMLEELSRGSGGSA